MNVAKLILRFCFVSVKFFKCVKKIYLSLSYMNMQIKIKALTPGLFFALHFIDSEALYEECLTFAKEKI